MAKLSSCELWCDTVNEEVSVVCRENLNVDVEDYLVELKIIGELKKKWETDLRILIHTKIAAIDERYGKFADQYI